MTIYTVGSPNQRLPKRKRDTSRYYGVPGSGWDAIVDHSLTRNKHRELLFKSITDALTHTGRPGPTWRILVITNDETADETVDLDSLANSGDVTILIAGEHRDAGFVGSIGNPKMGTLSFSTHGNSPTIVFRRFAATHLNFGLEDNGATIHLDECHLNRYSCRRQVITTINSSQIGYVFTYASSSGLFWPTFPSVQNSVIGYDTGFTGNWGGTGRGGWQRITNNMIFGMINIADGFSNDETNILFANNVAGFSTIERSVGLNITKEIKSLIFTGNGSNDDYVYCYGTLDHDPNEDGARAVISNNNGQRCGIAISTKSGGDGIRPPSEIVFADNVFREDAQVTLEAGVVSVTGGVIGTKDTALGYGVKVAANHNASITGTQITKVGPTSSTFDLLRVSKADNDYDPDFTIQGCTLAVVPDTLSTDPSFANAVGVRVQAGVRSVILDGNQWDVTDGNEIVDDTAGAANIYTGLNTNQGVAFFGTGTQIPTPSDTVVSETSFGQSPDAGTDLEYSRGDHTHGTPVGGGGGGSVDFLGITKWTND